MTFLFRHGRALADFHAEEYGQEYVPLRIHEPLTLVACSAKDKGWAFGIRSDGMRGWFPVSYFSGDVGDLTAPGSPGACGGRYLSAYEGQDQDWRPEELPDDAARPPETALALTGFAGQRATTDVRRTPPAHLLEQVYPSSAEIPFSTREGIRPAQNPVFSIAGGPAPFDSEPPRGSGQRSLADFAWQEDRQTKQVGFKTRDRERSSSSGSQGHSRGTMAQHSPSEAVSWHMAPEAPTSMPRFAAGVLQQPTRSGPQSSTWSGSSETAGRGSDEGVPLTNFDTMRYSRQTLLQVRKYSTVDRAREENAFIAMRLRPPQRGTDPSDSATTESLEDAVVTLVNFAGGSVKVGNLAAACLALGVARRTHSQLCESIVASVRTRPDLFGHISDVPPSQYTKLSVVLRSAIQP